MSVKAASEVTILDETDLDSLVTWYKLQTSATPPAAPTTTKTSDAVSGWVQAEPTFSAGTVTNYLYTVIQTRWKDGSCSWGTVQLSSSYEQAKQAWNKANAAQSSIDNLEVGGRNLLRGSGDFSDWYYPSNASVSGDVFTYPSVTTRTWVVLASPSIPLTDVLGDTVTLSFDVRSDDWEALNAEAYPAVQLMTKTDGPHGSNFNNRAHSKTLYSGNVSQNWERKSVTLENLDPSNGWDAHSGEDNWLCVNVWLYQVNSVQYRHFKLERGNKETDWTPAPEDLAAATDSVEYIVGTQTEATGSWTGVTKDSALYTGKTIAYKLPYAGSGNATLNLTLSGGGTTGAKAVYSMTTRVTTHYPANSIIQMTYNGTDWRTTGWYNTDTVNRTRLQNVIKAAAAITDGKIICGTASGYRDVAANVSFDLSYPLLYCATTKAANETSDNNFLQINGIKLTNTGAVQGAANYKTAYLKGTVTANTFKVASSDFLTCDVPTSDDGFCYIPLGMFYNSTTNIYFNSSKELYAYVDGAFGPVSIREAEAAKTHANTVASEAELAANNYTDVMISSEAENRRKYVSELSNGVWVHPYDEAEGQVITSEGVRITDVVEIIRDSQAVATFGESIVIGALQGTHVSLSSNRMSFVAPDGSEVAYISSDGNESVFYMTNAIVVSELKFGDWVWKSRGNGNLMLKWNGVAQ